MDAELQSALADAMRGESVLYVCYRYEDLHRLSKNGRDIRHLGTGWVYV